MVQQAHQQHEPEPEHKPQNSAAPPPPLRTRGTPYYLRSAGAHLSTPQHADLPQELCLKRAAFQRKQQALADALAIGARLARHRKRALQAAAFQAWRMRCHLFKQVALRLRGALTQRSAEAFERWRQYVAAQVGLSENQACLF